MKVNVNEAKSILFDELNVGDLFYSDGGVYIKIDILSDGSHLYNAVLLGDGSPKYIKACHCQHVNKLDGELNVKFCLD